MVNAVYEEPLGLEQYLILVRCSHGVIAGSLIAAPIIIF